MRRGVRELPLGSHGEEGQMAHHYQDKLKAERRERAEEKRREQMEKGKKIKLLHALAMRRAGVPDTGQGGERR